ncbi:MAG: hypothetical protein WC998_09275 [Candidatus Paceibacterota bacterium]|jgi:hypothetical protein
MLRICEISADRRRDQPGFMVVASRYAAQSYIRQHVIGWLKRTTEMACAPAEDIAVPENCVELVAGLMAQFPSDQWDNWRDHPAETGTTIRKMLSGATGAEEVHDGCA